MTALTDEQMAMLAFEKQTWTRAGSRDAAIRDLFGITPTRYHQLLLELIDLPEALAAEPGLVNRLRRRSRSSLRQRLAGRT